MTPEDFRAQLEWDLEWRRKELSILRNQLKNISSEEDKEIYCKTLLVMLYSHFEGFCKVAFLNYIKLINDETIIRSKAIEPIIASSLLDVFHDLSYPQNGTNCCNIFNIPSDETRFSRYFIRCHFIRKMDDIFAQEIDISERLSRKIVNTKSNLNLAVLNIILYRLGLPYNEFITYESIIDNMLMRRNNYAHGDKVKGIKVENFRTIEKEVNKLISQLVKLLTNAAKDKSYLKTI